MKTFCPRATMNTMQALLGTKVVACGPGHRKIMQLSVTHTHIITFRFRFHSSFFSIHLRFVHCVTLHCSTLSNLLVSPWTSLISAIVPLTHSQLNRSLDAPSHTHSFFVWLSLHSTLLCQCQLSCQSELSVASRGVTASGPVR